MPIFYTQIPLQKLLNNTKNYSLKTKEEEVKDIQTIRLFKIQKNKKLNLSTSSTHHLNTKILQHSSTSSAPSSAPSFPISSTILIPSSSTTTSSSSLITSSIINPLHPPPNVQCVGSDIFMIEEAIKEKLAAYSEKETEIQMASDSKTIERLPNITPAYLRTMKKV